MHGPRGALATSLRSLLRATTWFKGLAFLAFAALRVSLTARRQPIVTGDGHVWLKLAREPLFSKEFWLGRRPPGLSLLYKVVGDSDLRLVWAQTCIGVLAWTALALVVAESAGPGWLGALAFALVLLLGSSTPVQLWDVVIRSEALGLSCFVLSFAGVLAMIEQSRTSVKQARQAAWTGLALVSAALSALARETNGYLLPLLGVLCVAGAGVTRGRGWWRGPAVAAVSLSSVALVCQAETRASGRYAVPLMNVIFRRVLPDRSKLAYFRDTLGMPVSSALMERRSRWASADDWASVRSPLLADFRAWIHERGYSGYQRYLLARPNPAVREAYENFPKLARSDFEHRGRSTPVTNVIDDVVVHGPTASFSRATLAFLFGGGVLALLARSRRVRVGAITTLFLALATVTQAFICFHADAMEVERHGMMVGILLRLATLFGLLTLLSALIEARASRRGDTPRTSDSARTLAP